MAARPVRIGSLILVGKPRLTLGTIVNAFPFIAGPKPRDIGLARDVRGRSLFNWSTASLDLPAATAAESKSKTKGRTTMSCMSSPTAKL